MLVFSHHYNLLYIALIDRCIPAIFNANEINIYDECRRLREENTRLTVEMAKANQEMRAILNDLLEKKNG